MTSALILWVGRTTGEIGTSRAYNRLRPTNVPAGDQQSRTLALRPRPPLSGHSQADLLRFWPLIAPAFSYADQ